MSVLKNEANKLPKLKHTDKWYEVMANAIYKSFKKFSELKVFDPIQIKIKHKVVQVSNSMYYKYPEDSTKNHYFLG